MPSRSAPHAPGNRKEQPLFISEVGYVSLDCGIPAGLPETVTLYGTEFVRKPEFHVSLVTPEVIVPIIQETHQCDYQQAADKLLDAVKHACDSTTLVPADFSGELRLARVTDKTSGQEIQTLVAMCQVNGLTVFYERLCYSLETDAPFPPTHVTLYTLRGASAITLATSSQLEQRTSVLFPERLSQDDASVYASILKALEAT